MLALCHMLFWFPLRLHTACPAAFVSLSSPMLLPYMW